MKLNLNKNSIEDMSQIKSSFGTFKFTQTD